MIKNVLTSIGGIGMYGVISVCLFFMVFGGALLWTWLLRESFLTKMSWLPLEDEPAGGERGESGHE